ncbi:amidohydrolase family protein [Pseudooceanicola pacificus]|uniref:amidohydrolase family protein n=1 Tax=Pseudooceanicola pacificus TaxID=2676438 RepID=UPI001365CE1A|nr:amidohydrolase family protein [Pseudooceanicola pacificus]
MTRPLRLSGGRVWTGEGGAAQLCDLLIAGDRVEALLDPGAPGHPDWQVVDAGGCLILPPFYNAHVHAGSALARGTEDSLPLELWSFWAIGIGSAASEAQFECAMKLTAIEMIRGGIGGYTDHAPQARRAGIALRVHRQSGMRIGYAPFFADLWDEDILDIPADRAVLRRLGLPVPATPDGIGQLFRGLAAELAGSRVHLLLGPNAPQRSSDLLLDAWGALSDELGIGSHTHLLETFPQADLAARRWPGGVLDALRQRGLAGPGFSGAHAIWLTDRDYADMAQRGMMAVHNPLSNLMLGSGQMRLRAALSAGVRVGLGTDCCNTAGRYDMFETMRHALVNGRTPGSDFTTWIRPEEVLRAAACDGWAALGPSEEPRRIAPGAAADLQIIDRRGHGLAGTAPDARGLVSQGHGGAVRDLMIAGDWLMRDGVVRVFDEAAVLSEAADAAEALRQSSREITSALPGLVPAYLDWQSRRFAPAACPGCGGLHPPAARDGND